MVKCKARPSSVTLQNQPARQGMVRVARIVMGVVRSKPCREVIVVMAPASGHMRTARGLVLCLREKNGVLLIVVPAGEEEC